MLDYTILRNQYKTMLDIKIALRMAGYSKFDICEAIKHIKKSIREKYKRDGIKYYDYIYYDVNAECIIETIKKPLMNEEEKQLFIDDNELTICSPYDCTGQLFTNYIKFIDIPQTNKTIILHSKSYDV